jgi:transposase-like protein
MGGGARPVGAGGVFLGACYLLVRRGTREKEAIACTYAILENGKKVVLHLALGSRESYDAWLSFVHDMIARGLRLPVLVIKDGQPGMMKAPKGCSPMSFDRDVWCTR